MNNSICSIDHCSEKILALKLCNKHYLRFKRGSDINKKSSYEMSLKERLLSFCVIDEKTKCWNWSGSKNRKGYGALSIKNKHSIAHRESYKVFKGKIPNGMHVCHSCDNPSCINPDHLWLGTNKDNNNDKMEKGRFKPNYGNNNGNSKLTKNDVIEIKQKINQGYDLVEISKQYNVTPENIYSIKNNKTWRHVNV